MSVEACSVRFFSNLLTQKLTQGLVGRIEIQRAIEAERLFFTNHRSLASVVQFMWLITLLESK